MLVLNLTDYTSSNKADPMWYWQVIGACYFVLV